MKNFLLSMTLLFAGATIAQVKEKSGQTPHKIKGQQELVIEFISHGGGIDGESYDKIEKFIKEHPKKPVYEVKQQGREGEKKIFIKTADFTKAEHDAFVAEIKKLVVKPDHVLINGKAVGGKSAGGQAVESPKTTYRLILSFISQGAGVDRDALDKIKSYIEKYPKKPAFEEHRWGREGEVDFTLKLSELTADEQKIFVKDIKKLITRPEMVLISENKEYVKKGR